MGFHSSVIKFATIIFIVLVIVLSIIITLTGTKKVWPPEIAACPDYWEENTGGVCENTKRLVKYKPTGKDGDPPPASPTWPTKANNPDFFNKGVAGLQAKCSWATTNDVFWSGVSDVDNLC